MIDLKYIKEQHPKSFIQLKEFAKKYLAELVKLNMEEAGKQYESDAITAPIFGEHIIEMYALNMGINYRQLYDFFSENGIEVIVDYVDLDKEKDRKQFMYKIYTEPVIVMSYFGRIQTEIEAFKRAFGVLEDKL